MSLPRVGDIWRFVCATGTRHYLVTGEPKYFINNIYAVPSVLLEDGKQVNMRFSIQEAISWTKVA